MITVLQQFSGEVSVDIDDLLISMITRSDNVASDSLMAIIDEGRGPLVVTETMQQIGLKNTFIAMYFAPGSIPLQIYNTPANSRPRCRHQPGYLQPDNPL